MLVNLFLFADIFAIFKLMKFNNLFVFLRLIRLLLSYEQGLLKSFMTLSCANIFSNAFRKLNQAHKMKDLLVHDVFSYCIIGIFYENGMT